MRAPPNVAVRRFAIVWSLSLAVKFVALAVLLLIVLRFLGGF
ncbi:MAG TPA: hypothetical protein VJ021_01565 [Thermoplasmata archaeon]|nr:hypothetical protein [Thermoplasmata archaeon]